MTTKPSAIAGPAVFTEEMEAECEVFVIEDRGRIGGDELVLHVEAGNCDLTVDFCSEREAMNKAIQWRMDGGKYVRITMELIDPAFEPDPNFDFTKE